MTNMTYKIVYSPFYGAPLVSDKPAVVATIVSRDENLINFVEGGDHPTQNKSDGGSAGGGSVKGYSRSPGGSLLETKEDERRLVKAIDSVVASLREHTDLSKEDLAWLIERIKSHAKWGTLEVATLDMEYVVSIEEGHDGLEKLTTHYADGFIIPPSPLVSFPDDDEARDTK